MFYFKSYCMEENSKENSSEAVAFVYLRALFSIFKAEAKRLESTIRGERVLKNIRVLLGAVKSKSHIGAMGETLGESVMPKIRQWCL